MAKGKITYSEPLNYFSKEDYEILNGKKDTTKKSTTKKSTTKKPSTGKKKK